MLFQCVSCEIDYYEKLTFLLLFQRNIYIWQEHIKVKFYLISAMPPVQHSQYETGVSYYFQYMVTAYFAKTPRSLGR